MVGREFTPLGAATSTLIAKVEAQKENINNTEVRLNVRFIRKKNT